MANKYGFNDVEVKLGIVEDATDANEGALGIVPDDDQGDTIDPSLEVESAFQGERAAIQQARVDRAAAAAREEAFSSWHSSLKKAQKLPDDPAAPENQYDFAGYFQSLSEGRAPVSSGPDAGLPAQFALPGHPDFFMKTDPAVWTVEQAKRYIKKNPPQNPQEEAALKGFLANKEEQVNSLQRSFGDYGKYMQEQNNKALADKREYPHDQLLRDPQKMGAWDAFATPYIKGAAGFFTRLGGVEPLGDTFSEEQIKQSEKDHPVASAVGKALGGIGPMAVAVAAAPESLLGQIFAFAGTGAVSAAGEEKIRGSLMAKEESRDRIIKSTLKSAAYAPLWYYTKGISLAGRPLMSIGARAAARGAGGTGIEKAGGASTQEAVLSGLMTGALSAGFELTPYAINQITKPIQDKSIKEISDILAKEDHPLRKQVIDKLTARNNGRAPTQQEVSDEFRGWLSVEVVKNNLSTEQLAWQAYKLRKAFTARIPEVEPPGGWKNRSPMGERGSADLPFRKEDIVSVAGTIGKIAQISGDNALVVTTLGKTIAAKLNEITHTGLLPQEIPADHLKRVPENKKEYVKSLFAIENPNVVDEFIHNDPDYRYAINQNKELGSKAFIESENPDEQPEYYGEYIKKHIRNDVPPAQGTPEVVIWMGLPGSGKTQMAKARGLTKTHIQIDPDDAKTFIPESAENPSLADYVHKESGFMADKLLLARALEEKKNIIWPLIGKNPKKIARVIQQFKDAGYTVRLNYNKLSTIESKKRSYKRYLEDKRLVSVSYIDEIGEGTLDKNYEHFKPMVDHYESWDVNTRFSEAPRQLDKGARDEGAGAGEGGSGRSAITVRDGGVTRKIFRDAGGIKKGIDEPASSVISYIDKSGKKVYTKISKGELDVLIDEVKNIPASLGVESQIHLDALTPNVPKYGTEIPRSKFISGHSQAEHVFTGLSNKILERGPEYAGDLFSRGGKNIKLPGEARKEVEPKTKRLKGQPFEAKFKKQGYLIFGNETITRPEDIATAFRFLKDESVEHFWVVGLKDKKVVSVEPISVGIVNASLIHPREPVSLLAAKGATSFYAVHNHPSGDITASDEDLAVTRRLKMAYKMMGIAFDGHVIIDDTKFGFISPDGPASIKLAHIDPENPTKVPYYKRYREWKVSPEAPRPQLLSPREAAEYMKGMSVDMNNNGVIMYLDTRNTVSGYEIIKQGSPDVAEVFKTAAHLNATSILTANVWKDYDVSDSTIKLLRQFQSQLKIFGIDYTDAIEFQGDKYVSLREKDYVTERPAKYGQAHEGESEYKQDEQIPAENVTPQEQVPAEADQVPQEDVADVIESEYDKMSPEDQARYDLEMDDLRKTPEGNLFIAIQREGGIRPHVTTGGSGEKFMQEEMRDVPFFLKRKESTQTLDMMVSLLQKYGWYFEDGEELRQEIARQAASPVMKVDRSALRKIIRDAEKNKAAQQKMLDDVLPGKRRKWITTVKNDPKTSKEAAKKMESRYEPISNKTTTERAKAFVDEFYGDAVDMVMGPDRATTNMNSVGIQLMLKAQREGRTADEVTIAERMAEKQTELGQAIQVLSTLQRLSPEGIIMYAARQVRKAREGMRQGPEKMANFKKLSEGKTPQEIDDLAKKLDIPHISGPLAEELKRIAARLNKLPSAEDWPDFKDVPPAWAYQYLLDISKRLEGADDEISRALLPQIQKTIAAFNQAGVTPDTAQNVPWNEELQLAWTNAASNVPRETQIQTALLLKKIAGIIPPSLGKKISMMQTIGQLLNPKTFIRNVLGNTGFWGIENISDTLATMLDIAASLHTGRRTVYMPNMETQAKGFAKGLREGTQEALLGINLKGANASKYSLPANGVFDTGVMGALEKALRVSLSAPDRAAYQVAFNQSIYNQMRAAGTDEVTPEMIEKANLLGLYRTFQDDNVISDTFVRLKKLLNANKDFGMGDMVIKYPKTPGNILARGIEYSPFGFIRTAYDLGMVLLHKSSLDQESVVRSTARAATGSVLLVGAGALLAAIGIITGKRAKDRDVAAMRELTGLREYQVNVDALKRFLASHMDPDQAKTKEGDNLISYDWFLPSSIGLALGADLVLNPGESVVDKALNLGDRIAQASETLQQQPMIQGIQTVMRKENIAEGLADVVKGIPASFIPTLLNQIRQVSDNTARNTKDPRYFVEVYNKAAMRLPGLSSTLAPKIDVLGRNKEMYQFDSNNPFNVFLNPAFVTKYHADPVSRMVLDIWESSGETIHFPRVAQGKVKLGGATREPVELSTEQYLEYQKYIGTKTNILFNNLSRSPSFMRKPDDMKAKILQGYLTDINTAAKIKVLGYRPKKYDQNVMTILRSIGKDAREIKKNNSESDLGIVEDNDLGIVEDTDLGIVEDTDLGIVEEK